MVSRIRAHFESKQDPLAAEVERLKKDIARTAKEEKLSIDERIQLIFSVIDAFGALQRDLHADDPTLVGRVDVLVGELKESAEKSLVTPVQKAFRELKRAAKALFENHSVLEAEQLANDLLVDWSVKNQGANCQNEKDDYILFVRGLALKGLEKKTEDQFDSFIKTHRPDIKLATEGVNQIKRKWNEELSKLDKTTPWAAVEYLVKDVSPLPSSAKVNPRHRAQEQEKLEAELGEFLKLRDPKYRYQKGSFVVPEDMKSLREKAETIRALLTEAQTTFDSIATLAAVKTAAEEGLKFKESAEFCIDRGNTLLGQNFGGNFESTYKKIISDAQAFRDGLVLKMGEIRKVGEVLTKEFPTLSFESDLAHYALALEGLNKSLLGHETILSAYDEVVAAFDQGRFSEVDADKIRQMPEGLNTSLRMRIRAKVQESQDYRKELAIWAKNKEKELAALFPGEFTLKDRFYIFLNWIRNLVSNWSWFRSKETKSVESTGLKSGSAAAAYEAMAAASAEDAEDSLGEAAAAYEAMAAAGA